jgi:uncharacterized protein YoxC
VGIICQAIVYSGVMTNREKHDPNSQGYTNALLEDMDDKIQAVLEVAAPIPQIQENIDSLQKQNEKSEQRFDVWEKSIKLIPAIFEEVGSLRKDVETLKEAMKLLGRHDERVDNIDQRLSVVEQQVR